MRLLLIITLLMVCWRPGFAQQNTEAVWTEMKKLAAVYSNTARLSFDVMYRYAAAENPGVWLDSLNGRYKLNGTRYWYDINNVESIRTDKYVILLFKEDQVMYLSKPKDPAAGGTPVSPGEQMESFLKNDSAIQCSMQETKNQKKITIDFKVPGVYKRIECYISKQTGFLEKMVSWVRSDQLYDASVRPMVDAEGSYSIVETVYSNYKPNSFDDTLFSSERYFKITGNELMTVAPYDMYKIFKGDPNL